MIPMVTYPEVVKHYALSYQDVFTADGWIEFKRYISGLMVSENKTVDGINRVCVMEKRNQSSLNRLLTASPFTLAQLNDARLDMVAEVAGTRLKDNDVLGVDDTLLTHYGQGFEQSAKRYDHVSGAYVWAHNLVTVHYSDDETDYPLLFQLWKPVDMDKREAGLRAAGIPLKANKESLKTSAPHKWRSYLVGVWQRRQKSHPEILNLYDSKLTIAQSLLQQWVSAHPQSKLPVTFDNWYTQPEFCRFVGKTLRLPSVGTLTETAQVTLKDGQATLGAFAKRLKQEHGQALAVGGKPVFHPIQIAYKGEEEVYYSYCNTHQMPGFGKQRLVINHRQADLADKPTFYISNRLAGGPKASPAFAVIAGLLTSITKKARPKGWTSIRCGASAPSNDMSPWLPWSTACCGQHTMTLSFTLSFSNNSR